MVKRIPKTNFGDDLMQSVTKFIQRRYCHAYWHEPRLLYQHGLHINPHKLNHYTETFISRSIRSTQDLEMSYFVDYQRRGLPLDDPDCHPFNNAFAYYHLLCSKLHPNEFAQHVQQLKQTSYIIKSRDVSYLVRGADANFINSASSNQDGDKPYIPDKLKTKRITTENIKQYETFITNKIQFLRKKQFVRINLDSEKNDGSIKENKKQRKTYKIKGRKNRRSSCMGLIRNHLLALLLNGKLFYDDGTMVTLQNCGYIGSLIFQGEGESEQLLYLLFITDFKYTSSRSQCSPLFTYFEKKYYKADNGISMQEKAKLRKLLHVTQALWRKFLKKHKVQLALKLKFLGIENPSPEEQHRIDEIESKVQTEDWNSKVLSKIKSNNREAKKHQSNFILAENAQQARRTTLQQEEYLAKARDLLKLMPPVQPWDEISELKNLSEDQRRSQSIGLLGKLNNILFCITEDVAGISKSKKGKWLISGMYPLHPKLQEFGDQEQGVKEEQNRMDDSQEVAEKRQHNSGSNQAITQNQESDNELEFESISLSFKFQEMDLESNHDVALMKESEFSFEELTPLSILPPSKNLFSHEKSLKDFYEINEWSFNHEEPKSPTDEFLYQFGTLSRSSSRRHEVLIDPPSVVQSLNQLENRQFQKQNCLQFLEEASQLDSHERYQQKPKNIRNKPSRMKGQKPQEKLSIQFESQKEIKGQKKVKKIRKSGKKE